MCGRFEFKATGNELQDDFNRYHEILDITRVHEAKALYTQNIAPTDPLKIITFNKNDNVFQLQVLKWGIKSIVKLPDKKIEKDVFNSKIETISNKQGTWFKYMSSARCLVPMTAFYEWIPGNGSKKIPQRIIIDDSPIFYAGGIIGLGIDELESSSIITCEPNSFMKPIHNRMPVLFKTGNAADFLKAPVDVAISMSQPFDDNIKMSNSTAILEKNIPVSKEVPRQGSLF